MVEQRIGSYRIVRLLGQGGMGSVYEAVHERLERHVAIKVLHPRFSQDKDLAARFFNEARAAGLIDHPGVVQVFEFGERPDGSTYIVMEFIKGESLRSRIQRLRTLPAADAVRLTRQIAATLQAAHGKNIVHRDLKPDNVMIVQDPELRDGERTKVLDFGIAKLAQVSHLADGQPLKTATHALMGTPIYMSPEQCRGAGHVDAQTDVYSLGTILYQMLAGRPPFVGASVGELIAMHLYTQPPPLLDWNLTLPKELVVLVHRMLAKDPRERPTMAQIVRELELLGQSDDDPTYIAPIDLARLMGDDATAPVSLPSTSAKGQTQLGLAATEGPAGQVVERWPRPLLLVRSIWPRLWHLLRSQWKDPSSRSRAGLALSLGLVPVIIGVWMVIGRGEAPGMALVPGGTFMMGSSKEEIQAAREFCERTVGRDCAEEFYQREPQRLVRLSPFYLDVTEVTNKQFAAWLNHLPGVRVEAERMVKDPESVLLADLYPSDSDGLMVHDGRIAPRPGYERRPVVQVTWDAALRYCQAQGKRLPTEAEWEFAARGPEGHRFPWGDGEPRCDGVVFGRMPGRACASLGLGPSPVGSAELDRSPQGVLDLGGNVSEWVMDRFRMSHMPCRSACVDPLVDTPVLGEQVMRVVRGGNWIMPAESCRAAGRNRWLPGQPSGNIGFRCARPSHP